MPLLNFGNRRSAQAGNAGEIGKLDYRIGNPTVGQGVFLTGTTQNIPVENGVTPSVYHSLAAEDSVVVKDTAGTILGFVANSTTAQYIHVFSRVSVPVASSVPYMTFPIAASETIVVDFGYYGVPCDAGIVIANSTTQQTYTDGGDDCLFNVTYV